MKSYFRNGFWIIFIGSLLFLTTSCELVRQLLLEKPLRENDLPHYIDDVVSDTKLTFSKPDNIKVLLLAGTASVIMNQGPDKEIADSLEGHAIFDNFTERGLKAIGNPGHHLAATGLWYIMSINNDDEVNKNRAWIMLRALSVTDSLTITLKSIRNNKTPFGGHMSWPSGHTSSSFTVASVLDEFYGPQVGVPAYVAASLVGLRMIDKRDHWTSDIIFGAALGWTIGHTIAGEHKAIEIAGFKVLPYTQSNSGPTVGINLYKGF